jgi:Putative beta-barrel porin-2, OmpL-like. bbp2
MPRVHAPKFSFVPGSCRYGWVALGLLCVCASVPVRAQSAQGVEPASAEEVRQLRALVEQLVARDARIETQMEELKTQLRERESADASRRGASEGGATNILPSSVALANATGANSTQAVLAPVDSTQANAMQGNAMQAGNAPASTGSPLTEAERGVLDFLKGNTINFAFDGYYEYNFNHPYGRVNLLRAYDVLSNTFSLNQADVIFEHAPDVAAGRRFGMRLDLQFGQATETLQGNPANEPRPEVYRNIFQAYGTYVAPVGRGLTLDFGKWASSLGFENNYTKDQMNYSRSYWFNFLPFYHMGLRASYPVNDKLGVSYWVVNGTEQSEPTNTFKDQFVGLALTPRKTISWNVNYYLGQEHPDLLQVPNTGPIPVQPGLNTVPIRPAPDGRLHILDSYASWQKTPKLTLALEGDYVIERLWRHAAPGRSSAPTEVWGGAAYARYQLTPHVAFGGRTEYMSDRQGMFSGVGQALKETTATFDYKIAEGFLMRYEWRRDFSNQPYFQTDTLGGRSRQQNTATVGLVWWFGRKEGVW